MQRLIERARRILRAWGRDVALAAAGAALGLLIVVLIGGGTDPVPPTEPRKVEAVPPVADEDAAAMRPPAVGRPPVVPPAEPKAGTDPDAASPPRWRQFAASHPATAGRPMIAVIIDDLGLDRRRSARTVALPGPLTLSFLSYAVGLRDQTAAARHRGHELLVHVPMEPDNAGTDAGPGVIATALSGDEVRRRLRWALGRFDGYVGINNHMGSRFTANPAGMALVLEEVGRRGLLFVDSRTTPGSVARRIAKRLAVPFAERHVFLDNDPAAAAVRRQLRELERVAATQGYAVAIGHPRDATLAALEEWLPDLAARGFALVPVSAVVQRRQDGG